MYDRLLIVQILIGLKRHLMMYEQLYIYIVYHHKQLNRLGYGGGFYDRFLCKMGKNIIIKLGLAFSYQMIKYVPVEKFDKKLDVVLTDKEIFET